MAGRARALLAIAIVAMVAAAVALPALRVLPPPWLWFARRRGFLALYAVAVNKYGDPQHITNASFSVWAFYPTKNGTVFQGIYNGTGGLAYVNLSSLRRWAEAWIDYYGPRAVYSFMPSLIVFVSYPIKVNSTTIEVVSQQEMVPLNLSEPLTKRGEVVGIDIDHPFRFYYRAGAAGREYGGALAATVRPAQTTTTTTTSVPVTTTTSYNLLLGYIIVYKPHVLAWYPSNDSLGPISLAIVAAQPTGAYGTLATHGMIDIILGSSKISEESFNVVAAAGSAFSDAVQDAEVGAVAQAMSALSPVVPGASLTFTQVSEVSSFNVSDAYIAASRGGNPDVGQIYIVGQAALVNWTVEVLGEAGLMPVSGSGWQIGIMLTAVKVVESGGAMAPALYKWRAYDPCVDPSEWAQEYEAIEFEGLPPSVAWEVNQSCPIPNTPAPVDWMDYEYNMTQVFPPVAPGGSSGVVYVNIEVNGGESPIGVAIDAGSALVSAGAAAAALAAGLEAPEVDAALVIAAVLGSVNFATNSAAQSVNEIYVSNLFTNATVYAYISNMTPLYTSGGLEFTLPRELLLINASAS